MNLWIFVKIAFLVLIIQNWYQFILAFRAEFEAAINIQYGNSTFKRYSGLLGMAYLIKYKYYLL